MYRLILISLISFFAMMNIAEACEIEWKVIGKDKSKKEFAIGDEIVIQMTVFLTHRNCPEGIHKTKLHTDGIEILQATKWKESSTLTYERKYKVRITGSGEGNKVKISAARTCDKEGGYGILILKTK